jgi:hypothetical protein
LDPIVSIIAVGAVISMVEVLKVALAGKIQPELQTKVLPLIVMGLSVIVYTLLAMMYPDFVVQTAVINGIILGAISSGIYGMGKSLLEQMPTAP